MSDIQLRAGFYKELLAFSRTNRIFILTIVFIGIAAAYPLLVWGSRMVLSAAGAEVFGGMDILADELLYNATAGLQSGVEGLTTVGLLVFLLLINSFAGGEQKRRSIIIPRSAGLNNFNYIFPKFIVYPVTMFLLTFVSVYVASFISGMLFENNNMHAENIFISASLAAVFNMLYVCLHLTLGTATGKAGMSSAICIVSALLVLPVFFAALNVLPETNPFIMNIAAMSIASGLWVGSEVVVGVVIAFVIMIVVFFIALFVQNAKKIDNRGNEVII